MKIKKIKKCRICKSKNLKKILNLGYQNLQGYFIDYKRKPKNKFINKKFLTELVRCDNQKNKKSCGLLQLSVSVPSDILYKKYFYRSGINSTMRNHLQKCAIDIEKFFKRRNKLKILDIGCNDGTLLNFFSNKFIKYGIDPSDSFPSQGIKNVNYIKDFFPSKKLMSRSKNLKFDLITSIAMFYDLEDPSNFVKNIYSFLNDNGLWVFEVSYMPKMLKLNSFDTICHEHLEYYSLSVINKILLKNNMKLVKIELNNSNGGSIRCVVAKNNCFKFETKKNKNEINKLLNNEKKLKLEKNEPYLKFANRVITLSKKLKKLLTNLQLKGKRIHVYGASTKGNTILQYCKINKDIIKFAADRNLEKDGLSTLGSNISIISEQKSRNMKPDYYLALPWHFKKEFIKREKKFLKNGGKFIFPLPKVEIV